MNFTELQLQRLKSIKKVVSILVGVQLEIPFLTHHLLIQALPLSPPFFKTYLEVCSGKWVISPADFHDLNYYTRYVFSSSDLARSDETAQILK